MTIYQFANNASTTLGSSIAPTDTTITVASGTGNEFPLPAGGQYFVTTLSASPTGLPNEIVKVTARTGDAMTVVRAQEGTTAQSWSVGDRFQNFVSAGFLNQLVDSSSLQGQAGNYAVDSGTANVGVIALTPAPANMTALVGVPVRVKKAGASSTGGYTLNINALGATVVLIGGAAFEGGELVANEVFEVIYDGIQFNLISNPGVLHGDRIAANSIVNAALAQMTTLTLKGNLGGGTATPYDVPLSALETALGFGAASLTQNGYYTLPGGLIVQWGRYSYVTPASLNIVFPIAFPTACFIINLGMRQTLGSDKQDNVTVESEIISLTGFTAFSPPTADNDPITMHWIALGK